MRNWRGVGCFIVCSISERRLYSWDRRRGGSLLCVVLFSLVFISSILFLVITNHLFDRTHLHHGAFPTANRQSNGTQRHIRPPHVSTVSILLMLQVYENMLLTQGNLLFPLYPQHLFETLQVLLTRPLVLVIHFMHDLLRPFGVIAGRCYQMIIQPFMRRT